MLANVIKTENALPNKLCQFAGYLVTVTCACSVCNLAFIALNRWGFVSIEEPHHYCIKMYRKRSVVLPACKLYLQHWLIWMWIRIQFEILICWEQEWVPRWNWGSSGLQMEKSWCKGPSVVGRVLRDFRIWWKNYTILQHMIKVLRRLKLRWHSPKWFSILYPATKPKPRAWPLLYRLLFLKVRSGKKFQVWNQPMGFSLSTTVWKQFTSTKVIYWVKLACMFVREMATMFWVFCPIVHITVIFLPFFFKL